MIKKVLYHKDEKFYWEKNDLHSQFGVIKEDDIKKAKSGSKIKSNIGKDFIVLDASIIDNLEKIKRGPAIMISKDIGWLIVNTGIDKDAIVIEAGSGSGMLAINLARFCKKIISYEKNKQFYDIAKSNIEKLELKNIIIKNKDIVDADEKNVDAVFLDLLDPWNLVSKINNIIKNGGYLGVYCTNINQVANLVNSFKDNGFMHVRTAELIEREWWIEDIRVRPKSSIIGHTGFLTIARKI